MKKRMLYLVGTLLLVLLVNTCWSQTLGTLTLSADPAYTHVQIWDNTWWPLPLTLTVGSPQDAFHSPGGQIRLIVKGFGDGTTITGTVDVYGDAWYTNNESCPYYSVEPASTFGPEWDADGFVVEEEGMFLLVMVDDPEGPAGFIGYKCDVAPPAPTTSTGILSVTWANIENQSSIMAVRILDEEGNTILVGSHGSAMEPNLTIGNVYKVYVQEPLGMKPVGENPISFTATETNPSFVYEWTYNTDNKCRGAGWWDNLFDKVRKAKHHSHCTHNRCGHKTPEDLPVILAEMTEHYSPWYNFFDGWTYEQFHQALTLPKHPTRVDRVKKQLTTFVLNFASQKIGQFATVSLDDRIAAEFLTFVSDWYANYLATGDATGAQEIRNLLCRVNNRDMIAVDEIPASLRIYKGHSIDYGWSNKAEEVATMPMNFSLEQAYPNPFNPTTNIQYALPADGFVSVKVFNLLGEEVATVFEGMKEAGRYTEKFNAANLPSGVYLCRVQSNHGVQAIKLMLMK